MALSLHDGSQTPSTSLRHPSSKVEMETPEPKRGLEEYGSLSLFTTGAKLQALVYDILSPTTAITDYAVSLRKLSAN